MFIDNGESVFATQYDSTGLINRIFEVTFYIDRSNTLLVHVFVIHVFVFRPVAYSEQILHSVGTGHMTIVHQFACQ